MALYSRSDSRSNSSASPLFRKSSNSSAVSLWQQRTSFKGSGQQPAAKALLGGDLTARAQPSALRSPTGQLRGATDAASSRSGLSHDGPPPRTDVKIGTHRPQRALGADVAPSGRLRLVQPPLPPQQACAPSPNRPASSQPASVPAAAAGGSCGDEPRGRPDAAPPPKAALGKDGRPIAYVCYLCGAQYGSRSLRIHIGKCEEKWLAREEAKPRQERRPLPRPPAALNADNLPTSPDAIEVFNAEMFAYYNSCSLCQCRNCGRSFNEEAFARHAAMCTPERPVGALARGGGAAGAFGGGASSSTAAPGSGWPAQKPRAYVCYLCGQQYGSQSLKIHIPSCQDKFLQAQLQKPKQERRRLPPPPPELDAPLPSDPAGIDAFNCAMFQYYNGVSLCQCRNCGRSFNADAFDRHKKMCTAEQPGGPGADSARARLVAAHAGEPKAEAPGAAGPPRGYVCYLCGRQYGSASLRIHAAQCLGKWEKANSAKPASARRAPPPAPPELAGGGNAPPLPTDAAGVDEFNARSAQLFNDASLVPCGRCGRTFSEEAFARHGKVCTAERPFKPLASRAAQPPPAGPALPDRQAAASPDAPSSSPRAESTGAPKPSSSPRSLQAEGTNDASACRVCGRMFARSALQRHQAVCESAFVRTVRTGAGSASTDGCQHGVPMQPAPAAQIADARDFSRDARPAAIEDGGAGEGEDGERAEPSECRHCGRSFNAQALARHERICGTVFQSKRKPLDMTAQRLAGVVEQAAGGRPAPRALAKPPVKQAGPAGRAPKWKAQSEEMRAAMQASREVSRRLASGESLVDIPYVPTAPDPSLVQCPHCSRRYNEQAAARHIPLCANIVNKPKFLKAGTGGAGRGAPTMLQRVPGR